MKTQFSKDKTEILEKKKPQNKQPVYESSLPLKNICFDTKYLTSLNKDPAFLGKLFPFSTHIATPFHFAQWCRQELRIPTQAWGPDPTTRQGAESLGLFE